MMRWRLRELMGDYQAKTGERMTYDDITSATGLSPNTLSLLSTGKAQRADVETIEKLLTFFSQKLGRQLQTGDLLRWEPEDVID